MELNFDKRSLVQTGTRHLGFHINLSKRVISVTTKHKRKIVAYFDRFLATMRRLGRLLVKDIQNVGFTDLDKHSVQDGSSISNLHL